MATNNKRDFLGVPITLLSRRDAFEELLFWRAIGRCGYVTFVNPHSILMCGRDVHACSAITQSHLTVPDGVGIAVAARLLGYGHIERLAGPSLMLDLCDWGRQSGLRHFFLGGGEGVAASLAERLAHLYPGLQIAGTFCPPFRSVTPEEEAAIVDRINTAAPDLVWVGLGTGKQERWMAAHVGRLRASALLGVGAAFDFHSGRVPWAPPWVRLAGFEWAYRLAHEPRRLWRRNVDGFVFLVRVLGQRLGIKKARIVDPLSGTEISA